VCVYDVTLSCHKSKEFCDVAQSIRLMEFSSTLSSEHWLGKVQTLDLATGLKHQNGLLNRHIFGFLQDLAKGLLSLSDSSKINK